MQFIKNSSTKYLDNDMGEKGADRDLTRGRLETGKGVSYLVNITRTNSSVNLNDDDLMSEVETRLYLKSGSAKVYHAVHALYVKPTNSGFVSFTFKFLCGAGYPKLVAFAPFLKNLYANPQCEYADKVCLTPWSIEVAIPKEGGTPEWWELRELTVEQIKNLETLMGCGMGGRGNVPAAATPGIPDACTGGDDVVQLRPDAWDDCQMDHHIEMF